VGPDPSGRDPRAIVSLRVPLASRAVHALPPPDAARRFIAYLFEWLAILASACFHDDSNASTEEVHMKIHWTNRQLSMLCAAAAAGNRALLG
jgi:hypothetical protein